MPRQKHEPTEETRDQVMLMVSFGVPVHSIAAIMHINHHTLYRHYRLEIEHGRERANTRVGMSLFNSAIKGNVVAQIFWLKTRAGWRESSAPRPPLLPEIPPEQKNDDEKRWDNVLQMKP